MCHRAEVAKSFHRLYFLQCDWRLENSSQKVINIERLNVIPDPLLSGRVQAETKCTIIIAVLHTPIDNQTDQPTLIECVRFRGRERRINIPQEIGIQFYDFSKFLLEDDTGARTRSIAFKHRDDAEQINMEVLRQWINGRGKQPVTWKTLTEVLRDSELNTLAGDIEAVKCCEEEIIGQVPIGISDDPVEGDKPLTAETTEESEQSSTCDVHTEGMEDVNYSESLVLMVDIATDSEKKRSLLDRNFEAELLAIDSEDSNEKKENERTSVSHGTGRRTDTRPLLLITSDPR